MPKIIEYIIVIAKADAPTDETLTAKVNEKIADGYQPFGSLATVNIPFGGGTFIACYQPMVKYED